MCIRDRSVICVCSLYLPPSNFNSQYPNPSGAFTCPERTSPVTVSYTHLDVYKRQVQADTHTLYIGSFGHWIFYQKTIKDKWLWKQKRLIGLRREVLYIRKERSDGRSMEQRRRYLLWADIHVNPLLCISEKLRCICKSPWERYIWSSKRNGFKGCFLRSGREMCIRDSVWAIRRIAKRRTAMCRFKFRL